MNKRRMGVRLVLSEKMGKGKSDLENKLLRVPSRSRKHFSINGDSLTVEVGNKTVRMEIRHAYSEDVTELTKQVKGGMISEEEASRTAFVTKATLARLSGKSTGLYDKDCYISNSVEELTIGADPEFALVEKGNRKFKYASHVITHEGTLGSDGPLAEVRPPPERDASKLVKSIKKILKVGVPYVYDYDWYTGATYRSPNHPNTRVVHIGGHIHIGDPKQLPSANKSAVYERIIRVLDETIAVPLVRIDSPEPALRRNTEHNGYGRYGRWGDQRPQEGRFEWRVPSGLWLAHPEIAEAVLGTTKAVSETCYQLMADNQFNFDWISARADRKGFLKKWGAMNANIAKKIINESNPKAVEAAIINRAETKLKSMENYSKYKSQIDTFLKLVRLSDKDRSSLNLDMKKNWINRGKFVSKG